MDALLSDVLALPASLARSLAKLQLADGGEVEFSAVTAAVAAVAAVRVSSPLAALAGLPGVFGAAAEGVFSGGFREAKEALRNGKQGTDPTDLWLADTQGNGGEYFW